MRLGALLICTFLMIGGGTAQAGLLFDGETIRLTYEFPAVGSIFDTRTFVVGAGVEAPAFPTGDPRTNTDFSDMNITSIFVSASSWTGASFNGYHVFDLNGTIPAITSVLINPATNMAGLTLARISWDADNIYVNWQGLPFNSDTVVSIDVNTPEPATLVLMGSGLALLAAGWRRRRRPAA